MGRRRRDRQKSHGGASKRLYDRRVLHCTEYVDTMDIEPSTTYIYRVSAINAAGDGEAARVVVTTSPAHGEQ